MKKLSKSLAPLLAKEQRARDKQQRWATKAPVETLALELHEVLAAPAGRQLRRAAASS